MKFIFLASFVPLGLFTISNNSLPVHSAYSKKIIDSTAIIHHKLDGNINEWPSAKFETDLSTDISYAIDNDKENLYLAMNIPNEGIQIKMVKTGMKLFIDLKGKKKEGRGVAFPVKEEVPATANTDYSKTIGITDGDERKDPSQKAIDKKTMRSLTALKLTYMNVFGFDGVAAHDQGLKMPGSINIAFAWDTADVMHVEYIIPLKMLENSAQLDKKEISIGWRINGIYPSDKYQQGMDRPRQHRAQPGNGANTTGFDPTRKPITRETIIRENNIWAHYSVNLSAASN